MKVSKLMRHAARSLGGQTRRRDLQLFLLHKLSNKLDIRSYVQDSTWHRDHDFLLLMRAFDPAYERHRDRQYALYQLAQSLGHLAGDTVECGVYRGASSHLIMSALGPGRDHHVFDSFAGLSLPVAEDEAGAARPPQAGAYRASLDEVRRRLAAHARVRYYEGWIPERFGEVADRRFALVHVDVDLYAPTRDSAQFFFPRLVDGGLLVCDDYGSANFPGARRAMDEVARAAGRVVAHLPSGQGLLFR